LNDTTNKLVIDLGKTNIKFVVINNNKIKYSISIKSPKSINKKLLFLDIKQLWKKILNQLKVISKSFNIDQITTITHGATFAVIKNNKLIYPILDYETKIPLNIEKEYNSIRDDYKISYSPKLPNGLNVGKQIYFYVKKYNLHKKNIKIIFFPQFFSLLFSGKTVNEQTYLGCHTDLWDPINNKYSKLVKYCKWEKFFYKIKPIGYNLGKIRQNLIKLLKINPNCSVLNGGHDSSIAYAAFISKKNTTPILINSGTWTIIMSKLNNRNAIQETLDMYIGTNIKGKPIMVSRFMGGREYNKIKSYFQLKKVQKISDIKNIIENEIYCLPSFSNIGGPFKFKKGKIIGIREFCVNGLALSSLYLSLMTTFYLRKIKGNKVIIEGNLSKNLIFCYCLSQLNCEKKIYVYESNNTISHGFINILSDFKYQLETKMIAFETSKNKSLLNDYYTNWISLIERS